MTDLGRPVKIVRVIARLNTGGPAIHTILLTDGLDGGRFRSRLVTGAVGAGEGDMAYCAARMAVRPVVIPALGRDPAFASDLKALWRLWRFIWREGPDIVHTHTAKAGVLGRLAGLFYNVLAPFAGRRRLKMVHTFHGHIFHGYFAPFWSKLLVFVERVLARMTHRIIAVSEAVKDDLVHRYRVCSEAKVVVVPLGLDFGWVEALDDHVGSLRRTFGVPADVVTIGIVGRLTPVKNHGLLFAALRLLDRKVAVLVVGDGELRAELEAQVRALDLQHSVFFTGWLREPARIYADIDIVCLTSRNEGTPVALIEAMAARRPVVATNVGGVADLMAAPAATHDGLDCFANGILVPPGDAPTLARALRHLVDRADVRAAMGATGRTTVLDRHSRQRLLRNIETLYGAVLHEREGGL